MKMNTYLYFPPNIMTFELYNRLSLIKPEF